MGGMLRIYCYDLFQYVSLLRPPVTESAAPGAEVIDKVEWKQVSHIAYSSLS